MNIEADIVLVLDLNLHAQTLGVELPFSIDFMCLRAATILKNNIGIESATCNQIQKLEHCLHSSTFDLIFMVKFQKCFVYIVQYQTFSIALLLFALVDL